MLVALAGGVGAARLLAGMVQLVDPAGITAVVNTGDDMVLHGLHISPDLDTITYTLAGIANPEAGWGIAGESWVVMEELEKLGGAAWFRLGDRDLATHLYRTQRMTEGATLSTVTSEIGRARGIGVNLVPMSDDVVRTMLVADTSSRSSDQESQVAGAQEVGDAQREISFQEYFVKHRHGIPVRSIRFAGASRARPAPGLLEAIAGATAIVVCPSNPLLSIAPIMAVTELREAVSARREHVVAISPIVAGTALKGPADRLLIEMGHESSAAGVARLYAPWCSTLVIDSRDEALIPAVEALGMRCVVTDTIMSTPARAAELAKVVLDAVR
ncbi:MAG: 2-phospho-L-lactate transferase [Actinomycetota bacterium]|nr:2-phospho-L-lactate transferase [Actinomycetota bacterium]